MSSEGAVLRVERGRATDEELAAVTVLVMAMLAAQSEDAGAEAEPTGDAPLWRPEQSAAVYRSPFSWQ